MYGYLTDNIGNLVMQSNPNDYNLSQDENDIVIEKSKGYSFGKSKARDTIKLNKDTLNIGPGS